LAKDGSARWIEVFARLRLDEHDAIVGLAETFGVRTVAEGVETAAHARLLHELGCQNCRDSASRPHAGRGAAGLAGPDCGVRRLTELPG
jgi:predicted signal transduction protein with EAL and GGDEF domain